MKNYDIQDLRNLAIVGHGDAGKTSLVSAMLFISGAVNRLGKVTQGNAVTDFDEDEHERQISIGAALAHLEWNKKKLNLIDTPGYGAFIGEAKLALRVADAALFVVCGVAGIEVQTEKTWSFADEFSLPRILVVNKLDRDRAEFARTVASIHERFGRGAVPLQIPIGKEKDFKGVIDLLDMKAYVYQTDESGKNDIGDIPAELADEAQSQREKLMEMVAESDDALMEKFFDQGELTQEELIQGIHKGVVDRKLFPILCAAAGHNIGVQQVLDGVVRFLPSPVECGEVTGKDPKREGETITRKPSIDEPFSAYVFKTVADPFAGRITFFRVYSGSVKSDSGVYNVSRGSNEKFGTINFPQGKELSAVPQVNAGDFGAVTKLKETKTGDTLADKAKPIEFGIVELPPSVVSFAIEPKSRGDEEKISTSLARLSEEDLTLKLGRDPQSNEWLMSTSGDLHAEVILGKLKRKFGVEAILHPPHVPYFETIKRKSEAQGKYKKQTGGRGQYGDCRIRMEPLTRGGGFEFKNEIFGGSIPKNFIPAVEKGIQEARQKGFLAGYPVVDFRVILYDGSYHTVDSSEMAFKIAGSMGFKKAMESAGPTMLEPIMNVEVALPEESMGDVMGDLNSRRGKVQGMQTSGSQQVIRAQVPMAEMLTYSSTLKSVTGGRGSYQMEFSHYEELPSHLQTKIVEEAKAKKEKEAESH
jgi:elongation factor G